MLLGKRKAGEEGGDGVEEEVADIEWALFACNKGVPVDVSMVRLWMDTLDPEKQQYCDLRLSVQNHPNDVLYVHSCIIAPKCPFIASLLETTMQESMSRHIVLRDPQTQSPKVLRAILFFLYTGVMTTDDSDYCRLIYSPSKSKCLFNLPEKCWGCGKDSLDGFVVYKMATFLQLDDVKHAVINGLDHHEEDFDESPVGACAFRLWDMETCPIFKACILRKMEICTSIKFLVKVMHKLPKGTVNGVMNMWAFNFVAWGPHVIPMYKTVSNLDDKEVGDVCTALADKCDRYFCDEVKFELLKQRTADNAIGWYFEALKALYCIEAFHLRCNKLSSEFHRLVTINERCDSAEQSWSVSLLWPLVKNGPYNVPEFLSCTESIKRVFPLTYNETQLQLRHYMCRGKLAVGAAFSIAVRNPYRGDD